MAKCFHSKELSCSTCFHQLLPNLIVVQAQVREDHSWGNFPCSRFPKIDLDPKESSPKSRIRNPSELKVMEVISALLAKFDLLTSLTIGKILNVHYGVWLSFIYETLRKWKIRRDKAELKRGLKNWGHWKSILGDICINIQNLPWRKYICVIFFLCVFFPCFGGCWQHL